MKDHDEDVSRPCESGYRVAEIEYHGRLEMDIVLVGVDSLETVRVIHSTYFAGARKRLLDQIRQLSIV